MIPKTVFAFAALAAFSAHAQDEAPPADEPAPAAEAAPEETAPPPEENKEPELTPAETAEIKPPQAEWSGEVGAGFLATDGNAQARSVNGKAHAEYKKDRWKNTFDASAVNTSGATGTAAERYLASDKVDYLFWEKNYAFLVGEYEKDLFGGTRTRTSVAAGVGRHFLTGPKHVLDVEVGVGTRQTEVNSPLREETEEAIGRVSGKYEWKFTEQNSISEIVKSESGADNTFSESVTQLKLHIVGNLSSAMSYTVRHNSDVPPEREHLDTETAINLVYGFGKK